MRYALSPRTTVLLFLVLALAFATGRWAVAGGGHASALIVAGSDFVDGSKTPAPVATLPGQGYDGQFFYRYALAPNNFEHTAYGVTVDHPAYRQQRIGYPVLVWLLSGGGVAGLVPYALIFVNILAFAGIAFYATRLVTAFSGRTEYSLYPLMLCGLYMCLARDLAEVVELFFFTAGIYYFITGRYLLFCCFATATLLTRETSLIALAPLLAGMAMKVMKKQISASYVIALAMPVAVFVLWKYIIYIHIPSISDAGAGYGSLGVPLRGIIKGFMQNLNVADATHIFQLIFWLLYFCWQVVFAAVVLRSISFRGLLGTDAVSLLRIIYLLWLVFALCFTDTIYCDDWGFVRIFSLWNMVGIVLLIAAGKRTGRLFKMYSATLVLLTIIRLIIKV